MGDVLTLKRYEELLPAFVDALVRAECNTVDRVAMFCAQIGHESAGLRYMEEIADGSAYEGRSDLGNVYPGDGKRFKGRGPIQVTGRYNYTNLSQWAFQNKYTNSPTLFVEKPQLLSEIRYGFLGAVWYWTTQRPMNKLADARDIVGATRAVNGGTNGLIDRKNRYYHALTLYKALLPEDSLVAAKDELISFIKTYIGPVISDVKDIREQLTGGRDLIRDKNGKVDLAKSYPGWSILGQRPDGSNNTIVDAVGVLMEENAELKRRVAALESK